MNDIVIQTNKFDCYRETVSTLNRMVQGEMVKRILSGEVKDEVLNYFIITNSEMNLIGIRKLIGYNSYKIVTWLEIDTYNRWIKLRSRKIKYIDVDDLFKAVMMVIDYYEDKIDNDVVVAQ